jgi:hypothetical protein
LRKIYKLHLVGVHEVKWDRGALNTETLIDASKEVGLEVNAVYVAVSSPERRPN